VSVEAICSFERAGTDDAKLADFEIVEADFRSNANAPIHGLERSVAVEEVEADAEGLIEKGLFAAAEKFGAAGFGGADVAGRRNAAAIEKSFGGRGEVDKGLLAENFGPDGFVALEFVAIEGVVPARLGVEIFALGGVAAVFGLLELPAIRNFVVDICDGWKSFGGRVENVRGIGVETMAKLAVRAERFRTRSGECRAELGLAREARASLDGGGCDQRDFEGDDFVGLERKISNDERAVIGSSDAKFVMAGKNGENAEDTFAGGGARDCLASLQIAQSELSAGNGDGSAGKAGVADDAVERGGILRLLTGYAEGLRIRFARLLGGGLLRSGLTRIARSKYGGRAKAGRTGSEGCAKYASRMARERVAHASRPEMSGMKPGIAH